jgi:hypothetical protein
MPLPRLPLAPFARLPERAAAWLNQGLPQARQALQNGVLRVVHLHQGWTRCFLSTDRLAEWGAQHS